MPVVFLLSISTPNMAYNRTMRTAARLFLAIGLFAAGTAGCRQSSPPVAPTPSSRVGTVTIEIESETANETLMIEDVADGTTVEEVMRRIDQIPVTIHGSGVTAFVDQLGETATSTDSGWTYTVDGEFANQGIGTTTISPPTTITWTFGGYE